MHYMWLWLGLGLGLIVTLLVTMMIQHHRCITTHYKYVHNALQMDVLSKVLPKIHFQTAFKVGQFLELLNERNVINL